MGQGARSLMGSNRTLVRQDFGRGSNSNGRKCKGGLEMPGRDVGAKKEGVWARVSEMEKRGGC